MSEIELLMTKALSPEQIKDIRRVVQEDGLTVQGVLDAAISDYVGYRESCIASGDSLYAHVQR